jgi:flagellar basal body-associated protein FliL
MSIFPDPSPRQPPSPPSAPPPQGPPPPHYAQPPQYFSYPPPPPEPPPASGGIKIAILFGAVIALLAACVYLYLQLDKIKKDQAKSNETFLSHQAQLDKLEATATVNSRTNAKRVSDLQAELERARRQASAAAGEAKQEALKKVDETAAKLQAAQEETRREFKQDLTAAKEVADTKISAVGSEVTNVKGDVAKQRADYEKTVAELKHANGEIDGHAVLIATNGKELAALRALGERTFVEFTIKKSKQPQKVADVLIMLKHTDPKKNRYSIDLTADDKTTEKRDRGVNEPLQFLTSKATQPYELIVNDVKKDVIVGYLSIPKVLKARN